LSPSGGSYAQLLSPYGDSYAQLLSPSGVSLSRGTCFITTPETVYDAEPAMWPSASPPGEPSEPYDNFPDETEISKRGERDLAKKIAQKHGYTWRALVRTSKGARTAECQYFQWLQGLLEDPDADFQIFAPQLAYTHVPRICSSKARHF
jgi:hypothetical protein